MQHFNKLLSVFLAFAFCVALIPSSVAFADEEVTADTPMPNIAELQEKVDDASAIYDEANINILEIEKDIQDINKRIVEIQREIPDARKVSNDAAREYYLMLSGTNTFLEILLGASSMADFFSKVEYTSRINQSFLDDINKLQNLNVELETSRSDLDAAKTALEEEQRLAEEALMDAQNARDVAEETARKIAEATSAATAAIAEAAEADGHVPESPLPPTSPDATPPSAVDPGTPEAPSEKQAFVNLWAPRIDAYMAGSPLAGYGYAFANAAYDYNVDPRWSPAIACLESGKGRYCAYSHNAWGWDHVDWPDWETAIYSHVRGLSIGYGYTISYAAAQKYCPPNCDYWFSFVSNQMTLI